MLRSDMAGFVPGLQSKRQITLTPMRHDNHTLGDTSTAVKGRAFKAPLLAAVLAVFSFIAPVAAYAATLDCTKSGNNIDCVYDATGGTEYYGVYRSDPAAAVVGTAVFSETGTKTDEDICLAFPTETLTYELYDGQTGGGGWTPTGSPIATDTTTCEEAPPPPPEEEECSEGGAQGMLCTVVTGSRDFFFANAPGVILIAASILIVLGFVGWFVRTLPRPRRRF